MKKYIYFISFVFMVKDKNIHENISLITHEIIESSEQIRQIENDLKEYFRPRFEQIKVNIEDVLITVLNYKLMKTEEEKVE